MPKILVVGNDEFSFPLEGDDGAESGGYGEEVSSWAEAVTRALQTVQQPNDIPISTATILNNITSPANVLGFSFDTSEVISIKGEYIVRRSTDSESFVQDGVIEGNYDGSNWNLSHEYRSSAGITFDMTPAGQITYTTTNLSGLNYEGSIIFKAKVFNNDEEA
jgi:hypothetical protein